MQLGLRVHAPLYRPLASNSCRIKSLPAVMHGHTDHANPVATSVSQKAEDRSEEKHSFTSPSPVLQIDESEYVPQLETKLSRLKELFDGLTPPGEQLPEIEVFQSPPSHYRMRAEFTMWGTSSKALQEGTAPDVHYIMYDTSSKTKPPPRVRIDQFPVGSKLMNALMPIVTKAANEVPVLREKLFQVNFHTGLSGESMVTLLYHKKLDEIWQEAAKQLQDKLAKVPETQGHVPHIIGRSRKQKVELHASHITERLTVNGKVYQYRQVEGSFSQPNAFVCQHMLSWAERVSAAGADQHAPLQPQSTAATDNGNHESASAPSQRHDHDLLELYCGNGNFTIPLAENFRRVVATELAKSSVEAAKHNIEANKVDNIFVARMSSEEFTEAWKTKATKRRLEGLGDWNSLNMKTVFVDPPRAGLDDQTLDLVAEFDRVIYISCNPETLRANLAKLIPTHRVQRFAAFDQFPYTHHLECGVYLVKR